MLLTRRSFLQKGNDCISFWLHSAKGTKAPLKSAKRHQSVTDEYNELVAYKAKRGHRYLSKPPNLRDAVYMVMNDHTNKDGEISIALDSKTKGGE